MRDSGRLHPAPCLLAVLLSLISPTAYSQPAGLQSFEAHYSISRQGITLGRLKLSLRFDSSGNYRYRADSEHTGLFSWLHPQQVEERSEGHFEQGQVIPQRYHYLRRHSDEKKQIKLQFDWQKRQVTTSTGDSRWRQLIETGTQDKFSQQIGGTTRPGAGQIGDALPGSRRRPAQRLLLPVAWQGADQNGRRDT